MNTMASAKINDFHWNECTGCDKRLKMIVEK